MTYWLRLLTLFATWKRAIWQWRLDQEAPALLEIATDQKEPVLPMVPAGSALHEFLVYDEGEYFFPLALSSPNDRRLAKEKARRKQTRDRSGR